MQKPLVVITGASSGIGEAIARKFSAGGFPVALLARRLEKLEALKKQLPGKVHLYALDVTDGAAVEEVFSRIEEEAGPTHVLVNNAGLALGLEPVHEASLKDWEKIVATNVNGVLYCTRTVLPHMVRRNAGHIINMGSIAGTYPYPGGNVYGATKAFVHQFSLNLRADLLGKNIRVSCIEPGLLGGTEFSAVRFRGDENRAKGVYQNTRPLTPEDVAEVVYFCHAIPEHVNINLIEMMPVVQASGALSVHRSY